MRAIEQVSHRSAWRPGLHLPGVRTTRFTYHSVSQTATVRPVSRMPARPGWPTNRTVLLTVPHFLSPSRCLLVCEHSHGSTAHISNVALSRLRRSAPAAARDRASSADRFMLGRVQTWTRDMRFHPHVHYLVPAMHAQSDGTLRRPRNPPSWRAKPWQCCFGPSCAPPCSRPTSTNHTARNVAATLVVDCRPVGSGQLR